ncbi:hypothetical protein [Leptolinea tardivitalis]|uniref:hypothetical protein n=1 Tax=Leptolinea tardivitalis TaxID=229920 RepID=UPI0011126ED3|nr:hypothetical protein [Leptolinea tardivitalis]
MSEPVEGKAFGLRQAQPPVWFSHRDGSTARACRGQGHRASTGSAIGQAQPSDSPQAQPSGLIQAFQNVSSRR